MWRAIYQDSFFRFLMVGGLIYVASLWFQKPALTQKNSKNIFITKQEQFRQRLSFRSTNKRNPTPDEFKQVLAKHLEDEILFREALKLGLWHQDPTMRRYLIKKMRFMLEDTISMAEPDDQELQAFQPTFTKTHPQQALIPAYIGFSHVYLNPAQRKETITATARSWLVKLQENSRKPKEPLVGGDPFIFGSHFKHQPVKGLRNKFGGDFIHKILKAPVGQWFGPLKSAVGTHLVFVKSKTPSRPKTFNEIRPQLMAAYKHQQRKDANKALYSALKKQYHISFAGVAL